MSVTLRYAGEDIALAKDVTLEETLNRLRAAIREGDLIELNTTKGVRYIHVGPAIPVTVRVVNRSSATVIA